MLYYIREYRQINRLSQVELALKAGVRRPTISVLENGGKARDDVLEKIAAVLGVSVKDLKKDPMRRLRGEK